MRNKDKFRSPTCTGYYIFRRLVLFYAFPTHLIASTILTGIFVPNSTAFFEFGDFVVFYAASDVLDIYPSLTYETSRLLNQVEIYSQETSIGTFYWRYPPITLFLIEWLNYFPYTPAALIWSILNIAVFIYGLYELTDRDWRVIGLLGAPSVLGIALMGQTGFLAAGLLALGLAFIHRQPIVSGVVLGFLSFKPHLALAVPIYLMSRRCWRVTFTAAGTVLALIALSLPAYGYDAWVRFFRSIGGALTKDTGWATGVAPKNAALFITLKEIIGIEWVWPVFGIAVLMVTTIFVAAVRRPTTRIAASLLIVGSTCLLSPKFMDYDAVMWLIPMALIFQRGLNSGFKLIDVCIVSLLWIGLPLIRVSHIELELQIWPLVGAVLFAYGVYEAFAPSTSTQTKHTASGDSGKRRFGKVY